MKYTKTGFIGIFICLILVNGCSRGYYSTGVRGGGHGFYHSTYRHGWGGGYYHHPIDTIDAIDTIDTIDAVDYGGGMDMGGMDMGMDMGY